ncbi:MAG: hypothetical protein AW08_03816 [Candidatus Accumulibacter adjunctus]|uniref:Uncharacterized protein n=1 Tax=Candidatus Accumulibacter adjunctus TaxID=1454001 RepID=A0A011MNQ5_9PROT|nr:MAG: hypothetical protein AW08_03816 [Candidatus Accumulibacter adjunctus]
MIDDLRAADDGAAVVATDLHRAFADRVAALLRDGARAADARLPGNHRRQRCQRVGRRLPLGESVATKNQRHREVAGQARVRGLRGAMLRQRTLRYVPLQVADQVGDQHLGRPAPRLRVPGQRLDQVEAEEAHAAVGAQVRILGWFARTQHGAPFAAGQQAGARRIGGVQEDLWRQRCAGKRRRPGSSALDRHAGRVAAIENDEQASRRQLCDCVGKVGGADRAAAQPPQVEVAGDQVVLTAVDVTVAAEVEDRRRVAIRYRRQLVAEPVERIEDRLAGAPGAGQQTNPVGRVAATFGVHEDRVQGLHVARDGGQCSRWLPVLIDGDQQRVGVLEAMRHPVSLANWLRREGSSR